MFQISDIIHISSVQVAIMCSCSIGWLLAGYNITLIKQDLNIIYGHFVVNVSHRLQVKGPLEKEDPHYMPLLDLFQWLIMNFVHRNENLIALVPWLKYTTGNYY